MPIEYDSDGSIKRIYIQDVPDAKLLIKELRLKKKGAGAMKKEFASQIAQLRAKHRSQNAHRPAPIRIPGTFGKVLRVSDQLSRASDRAQLDNAIRPLEAKKIVVERFLAIMDEHIMLAERYILENQ